MKKVLITFFVTLGVVFFVILLGVGYLLMVDPYNLKPLLFDQQTETAEKTNAATSDTQSQASGSAGLSDSQAKVLEAAGIDTSSLPTSITPEQEACFIEKFGQSRVDEIVAGDTPTILEILKGKDCI